MLSFSGVMSIYFLIRGVLYSYGRMPMRKNLLKVFALICTIALMVVGLEPLANDGSWLEKFRFAPKPAQAATSAYSFMYNGTTYNDGAEILYSNYKDGLNTIQIILKSDEGIPSGAAITWTASNDNIIVIESQNDAACSVTLNIKSPGYSGLAVSLRVNGIVYPAIAYCIIHVPLEWTDDDTNNPNILATNSNHYGLMIAQNGEDSSNPKAVRTLQLYTPDSGDNPDKYSYLRKIRFVQYSYKDDATQAAYGKTYVPSNIAKDDLVESVSAVSWESSDTNVVEVDSVTGVITAVHSGFARITVKTDTMNESTKQQDSLSFNVVVVPEAYVVGVTTALENKFQAVTNPTEKDIVVQSNAHFATDLSWKLYQGDNATASKEVTSNYKSNIDISTSTGRVVLSNLPAGVYYLTAISVKDAEASRVLATYDVTAANIQYLGIVLIVPIRFPADNLILNYYNANVYDSYDLLADSNLLAGSFRFSSSFPEVATVGENDGIVEAKGIGESVVSIVVTKPDVITKLFGNYVADAGADVFTSGGYKVNVTVVNGVAISSTSETIPVGASVQLRLTSPSPYEGDVIWKSSDTSIATVDETGLVTAVKPGDTYITVKIKVAGVTKQAKCRVKVVAAVAEITLSAKNDWVLVGDNLTISATVSPKLAGATLVWAVSDESIASIADKSALSMTITGVKEGTVVVSAINQDNAIVATKIIKVIQEITKLTLSDTDVTLAQTVGFYQLYAYCEPDLPDSQELKWSSSNKKVVTVDQNGKVTLVKPGSAVITVVTENGLIAQCNFTVTQGVTGITFDESEITLYTGEKHRLTYVIKPANASNMNLTWSSIDSKIATVDSSGYVTAKNVGTTVIIAKATDGSGIEAMCKVNVLQNATAIKIDVTDITLNVGDSYTLEVTLTPNTASSSISYESSNTKIATVNKKGKVTGKAKGNCVILVKTSNGLSAYVNVTVNQQVTGISLNETEVTIYVGEEQQLEATLTPKNVSDAEINWVSSNSRVVTVDKNGVIKGISSGSALVTATSADTTEGTHVAYCLVTVIEFVTEITIQEEAQVGVGKKLKLEATVSGETATNKNVTWSSSDTSIATINSKGVVKGVKVGQCIITVTALDGSGESAECELTVFKATESINIDPTMSYLEMVVGDQRTVVYELDPTNATYPPDWNSSDPSIAIVNKTGTITALKAGTTTIIASAPDDPSITATVVVKVINPINASSITFDQYELVMIPGETHKVVASFSPGNITESYTWSTDNPTVASVDSSGKIVANRVGTANVTLMTKNSGKKQTVVVYVVGLSETDVTLYQYEELLLDLQLDGQASANLKLRWGTGNQSIAVMNNGHVTAKATGTTKVYVVVNGRKLYCTVKVIKNLKR